MEIPYLDSSQKHDTLHPIVYTVKRATVNIAMVKKSAAKTATVKKFTANTSMDRTVRSKERRPNFDG